MDQTVLLFHGWGGNKPEHWQEWLHKELQNAGIDVRYPKFPNPEAPHRLPWMEAMQSVVSELPASEKVTILCHSLGAITWMWHVTNCTYRIADRVLLVAPPYVISEIPPADTPLGIGSFFPPPMEPEWIERAARETTIIAGEGDCYGTEDQLKAYADRLGVPMHTLAKAGHVSPYWGYGAWPWLKDWVLGEADFPPQPNT